MGLRDRDYMKGKGSQDHEIPLNESPIEKRLREIWEKHKALWIGLLSLVIGTVIAAPLMERM